MGKLKDRLSRLFQRRSLPPLSSHKPQPRRRTALDFIVTYDILIHILGYLNRHDLARYSRVNHLFNEICSRLLYTSDTAVEYGLQLQIAHASLRTGAPILHPQNLFSGLKEPHLLYCTWDPHYERPVVRAPRDPNRIPFYPSPMKVQLLRHVKHLTYHCHPPSEMDRISTPLFPALETLTINAKYWTSMIEWDSPFLLSLRPTHIRLVHIRDPSVISHKKPFRLNTATTSLTTRVTIHFIGTTPYSWKPHGHGRLRPIEIDWPEGMKHLDLVFIKEDHVRYYPNHIWGVSTCFGDMPPPVLVRDMEACAKLVVALLVSAERTGLRIRIIGLGSRFSEVDKWSERWPEPSREDTQLQAKFQSTLREMYDGGSGGVSQAAAITEYRHGKAEMLEWISLDEYWTEGNLMV